MRPPRPGRPNWAGVAILLWVVSLSGCDGRGVQEYDVGIACRPEDDLDSAVTHFNKVIRHNPDFAEAYYQRGLAYYDQGYAYKEPGDLDNAFFHNDGAIFDFIQTLRLKPRHVDARLECGKAYADLAKAAALGLDPE